MTNHKIMQKIIKELQSYKKEVDEIAVAYSTEKTKHEKELKEMKGKFTAQFIEESRKNWKPKLDYKKVIEGARETHQTIAENYLDELKSQLDNCFQIPVDSGFAATISAVKALGVTLNNKEFELLQGAAGSFWGLRLLNQLGISRTKTEQGAELENGQTKNIEKEVPRPYTGVELPNVEKIYAAFQSVKNAIDTAFEGYCGGGYALKDIIFPPSRYTEETNAKLAAEYRIQPPKPSMDTMQITKMANATRCFNEDYHPYAELSEMMDQLTAIIPKPKRKETLTDNDKRLIDRLIDPRFPTSAKSEAAELAQLNQHLAEILSLDSRYSEAVRKISGGENNE